MKIDSSKLADLMVEVANQQFGTKTFRRRQLMDATEQVVRQRGLWTQEDDELSGSVGTKSRGLAQIDFRFFDLKRSGKLVSDHRDHWRLASPKPPPITEFVQPPSDIAAPPDRIETHVQRIVRDTNAAKSLKALYDYKCQVCGLRIEPASGSFYIEVHHVRPLGGGHKGLDTHLNMLVLCPNHHAMFDFGIPRFITGESIMIGETSHNLTCKHNLAPDVIAYHNEQIHRRTA
jgi:putative restriction endonuclease